MKTYFIELEVDQTWLKVIKQLTREVYEGEVCTWIKLEEGEDE
jgi:hypothetical protein